MIAFSYQPTSVLLAFFKSAYPAQKMYTTGSSKIQILTNIKWAITSNLFVTYLYIKSETRYGLL